MAQFVLVPPGRLQPDVLQALLEEYINRDGTDYGARELTQEEKVARLRAQLDSGDLRILYDADSEQWDVVPKDQAELLLHS